MTPPPGRTLFLTAPQAARGQVAAVSNRLKDVALSGWDPDFWGLAWWRA